MVTVIIGVIGTFVASVIVDPLNMVGMPIIKGVNNYKANQDKYLDVFKPYEIVKYKPEVIMIGSSRIYQGIYPTLLGYDDSKVYNLGCSSLSIKDMDKYLSFVYEVSKPRKIFIGLDFFQFGRNNHNETRNGFSEERLMELGKSNENKIRLLALKENFQANSEVLKTIKESMKNKNEIKIFEHGWGIDIKRNVLNEKRYYHYLNHFINTYNEWCYSKEAMEALKRIVINAKKNEVEIAVFFNPISADLLLINQLINLENNFRNIKKEVTLLTGRVYDFSYINSHTLDRKELYYDPSHYNDRFGEIIKQDIINDVDTSRMMVLTDVNVDEKVMYQEKLKDDYIDTNKKYVKYLSNTIKQKKKLDIGDLKEYIGF